MSNYPEIHTDPCNECGGDLQLKFKKSDKTPFYVCENSHFYNPPNAKPKAQATQSAERGSKIICAACGCENNVMITSLASKQKPKQEAPQDTQETEETEDDIPF